MEKYLKNHIANYLLYEFLTYFYFLGYLKKIKIKIK